MSRRPAESLAGVLDDYAGPGSLVYGIGNAGRQDDGLGWAFVDWLEETGRAGSAELVRGYQVHLEDADLLSRFDRVLFIDSSREAGLADFALTAPVPSFDVPFSSHALTVPTVLATCRECFGRVPDTRLLAIRGYEFELAQGLSTRACRNLEAARAALLGRANAQ